MKKLVFVYFSVFALFSCQQETKKIPETTHIVTLNQKSGTSKYQITNDGLVSLNADGSKRDAKSAPKYLLKKVMGE